MGSLRQDLAPFISYHESNGQGNYPAQDLEEEDDWGSDDDAMILGTTPHVSLLKPLLLPCICLYCRAGY